MAGIDSNACEAQGGTWCQNPVDCSALSACVEDMKNNALETNHAAFENYLNSMPNITDPLNADHCGKAREYFGFDATFINDDTVCAEVDELRHSRNMDWMDEFFGQGTSETTAPGGTSGCPPPLPPVELEIPEMAEFDVLNEVDSCKCGTPGGSKQVEILHPHSTLTSFPRSFPIHINSSFHIGYSEEWRGLESYKFCLSQLLENCWGREQSYHCFPMPIRPHSWNGVCRWEEFCVCDFNGD